MNNKKILTAAALATILTLAAQTAQAAEEGMMKEAASTEKCYGVAKAGKNDCGTNTHACAGHAEAADGDKNEWISMPTGLCEKLVNGSLTPPAAEAKH